MAKWGLTSDMGNNVGERIFSGLVVALVVWSAPAVASPPLSWEACVKMTQENNPALRSALANLNSNQATTLASRSGFMPQVSGGLGYTYGNSGTLGGTTGVIAGGTAVASAGTYALSLTASQNIFNGMADVAKVDQGKANEGIADANLRTVKAQVSYNLKTSFAGMFYAKKSVQLANAIIARRETNLRLVQLRFNDGQENKGSVLLYQAYLKDAKYGELQSRDQQTNAKLQLAQALGVDDVDSLDIVGAVPLRDPTTQPDLKSLSVQAPTYEQALFQEKYADASVILARSAFFPTLGLTGSAGKTGDWFPDNNRWSVGLNLSVPLFNGGRDYYGTRAAVETRSAAQLTLHDVDHQNVAAIRLAYMNYVEAAQKLGVDQSYLDAAEVRAQIARADYNNGLTSFQDWDLAETDLINREKSLIQSEQNRITNEAAWEQAQGVGVIP